MCQTVRNRFKPDIVAPGDSVESAMSNGNAGPSCVIIEKAGTSMASPAVAGAAAVIRQFFQDSFFWESVCNKNYAYCKAFTPSGVLLKAMILHSGRSMYKFNGEKQPAVILGEPPDNYQGYGRVSLKYLLPVAQSNFDLFVLDLQAIGPNTHLTYFLHVTGSGVPLR